MKTDTENKKLNPKKKKLKNLSLLLLLIKKTLTQTISTISTQPPSPSQQALKLTHRISFNSDLLTKDLENSVVFISKSEKKIFELPTSSLSNTEPQISVKSSQNLPIENLRNFHFVKEKSKVDDTFTGQTLGFFVADGKFYKTVYPNFDFVNEYLEYDCDFESKDPWIDTFNGGGSIIFYICPKSYSVNGPGDDWGYVQVYSLDDMENPSK